MTLLTERINFFACKDVNVSIKPGEIFGIIGRSGAGKSTLVRCINLLNRPTSGTVIVDGKDLTKCLMKNCAKERRQIGMIFQHFNLSSRTVFDNVALPLELAGVSKADIRKKVEPLLELVGFNRACEQISFAALRRSETKSWYCPCPFL